MVLLTASARGQAPAPPTPPPPAGPFPPTLTILGFSPERPPGNILACRQAIALAIDREAVARAVAPHLLRPPSPARGIQHPALSRVNPVVAGYAYDPVRAKELFGDCGFSGPLRILAGGSSVRAFQMHDETVGESLRRTLAATVTLDRLATIDLLIFTARTGSAPVWMLPWVADRNHFGYPSFALGIGRTLVRDPEVLALTERGDALRAEETLLRKALIIPIIYF